VSLQLDTKTKICYNNGRLGKKQPTRRLYKRSQLQGCGTALSYCGNCRFHIYNRLTLHFIKHLHVQNSYSCSTIQHNQFMRTYKVNSLRTAGTLRRQCVSPSGHKKLTLMPYFFKTQSAEVLCDNY
jgi:hypothetical protein